MLGLVLAAPLALADPDPVQEAQEQVPCIDIHPDEIPPIHVYECDGPFEPEP